MQNDLRGGPFPLPFIHQAAHDSRKIELKVVLHDLFAGRENQLEDQLRWWMKQGISSIRFQPAAPIGKIRSTEALLPTVKALADLKKEPKFEGFIRNTAASFACTHSVIAKTNDWHTAAHQCVASDKIIFLTTDLQFLNCKSLWDKPVRSNCEKTFDLVCCGFQP